MEATKWREMQSDELEQKVKNTKFSKEARERAEAEIKKLRQFWSDSAVG